MRSRIAGFVAAGWLALGCSAGTPRAPGAGSSANLTIAVSGAGAGAVTTSPAGITCAASGAACTQSFAVGTAITLTATSGSGSTFAGFSGSACQGSTCAFTLEGDTTVGAEFALAPRAFSLSVDLEGTGTGEVTSSPVGIDCTHGTCEAAFDGGPVTLTATTHNNAIFGGWGGACADAGASSACTLSPEGDADVTATFLRSFTVSVTLDGSGAVASVPEGLVCSGQSCTGYFAPATMLTLTPEPADGGTFQGWSGSPCTGTASCAFNLAHDVSLTATFAGP